MGIVKKLSLWLVIMAVGVLGVFGVVRAADNQRIELPQDTTHEGLFTRAGETVVIAGTVNGDAWVAAQDVEITGTVTGNVYAAGQTVRITGKVGGGVHAAGSSVTLEGPVGQSVYVAGSDVRLGKIPIGHSAVLVGSQITTQATITDQLYAAAAEVTIDGSVGRGARVEASRIVVASAGSVQGDLRYGSDNPPEISNDKAITGHIIHDATLQKHTEKNQFAARLVGVMIGLVWNVVIAAVVLWLAPFILVTTTKAFAKSPIHNTLKGLGFVLLVPFGLILGSLTIIGIPLMVLAALVYVLVLLLAPVAVAYLLGQQAGGYAKKPATGYAHGLLATTLGLVIFTVLTLVPFIGDIFGLALYVMGAGILISRGFTSLGLKKATKQAKA